MKKGNLKITAVQDAKAQEGAVEAAAKMAKGERSISS